MEQRQRWRRTGERYAVAEQRQRRDASVQCSGSMPRAERVAYGVQGSGFRVQGSVIGMQ